MKQQLEQHNFKIDSTGWTKKHDDSSGIDYLENPEGDVWEIASGKLKGEQLFTWDGAMRETKKAGKKMPTEKEWSKLLKTKEDMPNLLLAGSRGTDGSFINLGTYAYFWSSSPSGSSAWNRGLKYGYDTVYRNLYSKASGLPCRCIKNDKKKVNRDKNRRFIKKEEKLEINSLKENIKVEKTKTTYRLSNDNTYITVGVNNKGKLTIRNQNGQNNFHFEKSSPKTVKAIGELLIKASEIK